MIKMGVPPPSVRSKMHQNGGYKMFASTSRDSDDWNKDIGDALIAFVTAVGNKQKPYPELPGPPESWRRPPPKPPVKKKKVKKEPKQKSEEELSKEEANRKAEEQRKTMEARRKAISPSEDGDDEDDDEWDDDNE